VSQPDHVERHQDKRGLLSPLLYLVREIFIDVHDPRDSSRRGRPLQRLDFSSSELRWFGGTSNAEHVLNKRYRVKEAVSDERTALKVHSLFLMRRCSLSLRTNVERFDEG
jgi:hypothetical protein